MINHLGGIFIERLLPAEVVGFSDDVFLTFILIKSFRICLYPTFNILMNYVNLITYKLFEIHGAGVKNAGQKKVVGRPIGARLMDNSF